MKINKKVIIGIMVILLVILAYRVAAFYQSHQELQEIQILQESTLDLLDQVRSYYEDPETGFLLNNIDDSDIEYLQVAIADLQEQGPVSNELIEEFQRLKSHYEARQNFYQLFEDTYEKTQSWQQLKYRQNMNSEEFAQIRNEILFVKPQDAFENQINFYLRMIEAELDTYESGLAQLEYLNYIPINVRNYALIARTLEQAEIAYDQVNNQYLKEDLNEAIKKYSRKFIDETQIHWQELPVDYVASQLSFSEHLSAAFDQALLAQNNQELSEEDQEND